MPGITDVSFLQMKRNNTLFNYTAKNLAQGIFFGRRECPFERRAIHSARPDYRAGQRYSNSSYGKPYSGQNIPTPVNETVIRNPSCPMTCLIKRMAEYRKAKNTSIELNSASDHSVHPRCDARLDTEFTISPIDVLEQQIIVTPGSEENGDQTSYFARPVPIVESSLEDASESDKTNSGVGGWEYHEALKKRPKKDPCQAIAWQQSGQNYHIVKNHICQNEHHKKIRMATLASIAEPLLLKAVKANLGATLPGFHAIAAAGKRLLLAEEKNADVISFSPPVCLLYVFMSEKRETIDYVKILKAILTLLDHQTAVEEVVTDFERSTWRAFEQPGIWSPEPWSVFFQIIRTNNDAEGWYNKLNKKGKGAGLHFYKLVQMLYLESEFVEVENLI
ncbi:hypothetical protein DAPPUDRAFT_114334 [Daphnia pulex]|uniref:Uncharacterized protein n=1 Tax=Daphnia pulex TaxID=6669 RepID=E9HHV6_DAPPU|nr:hypothetical protein DAPPUDRAFT_114334 [Daphnia pulex]|eukprot:EFX68698.1 hypothetical protein DAPPUDRAFT_114334 [Daphnia pulex]